MKHSFAKWAIFAIPFGILLGSGSITSAPLAKNGGASESKLPKSETIRKALDTVTTIDFANQSLPSVLSALETEHKIKIVLDPFVISMNGMDPSELMVDISAKETRLREGLRSLLGKFHLTFGIVGDHLFVSDEDTVLHQQLKQRINIDVEEKALKTVLKDLSKQCSMHILIDPKCLKDKKADAPITLSLDDIPFETAVRLSCEFGGLKPVRIGNVLFVTTEDRADKLKDHDLAPTGKPNLFNQFLGGIGGGGIGIGGAVPIPVQPPPPGEEKPVEKKEEKKEEKKDSEK